MSNMNDKVSVKIMQKLTISSAAERPDVAVLAIAVTGDTAYYAVPHDEMRRIGERLIAASDKMGVQQAQPN